MDPKKIACMFHIFDHSWPLLFAKSRVLGTEERHSKQAARQTLGVGAFYDLCGSQAIQ